MIADAVKEQKTKIPPPQKGRLEVSVTEENSVLVADVLCCVVLCLSFSSNLIQLNSEKNGSCKAIDKRFQNKIKAGHAALA